jgi:hypothetical protein
MCASASHHRDIAALVKRMVERNEQCSVSRTASSESLEQDGELVDDEGYDSGETAGLRRVVSSSEALMRRREGCEVRRASEMRFGGACVSKQVRFRRGGGVKRS